MCSREKRRYILSMQTAFHILALTAELNEHLPGGTVTTTDFYKKARALYLHVKHKKTAWVVGFLYHPTAAGMFLIPKKELKLQTSEKPRQVFELTGMVIKEVAQIQFDRIVRFRLSSPKHERFLVFEAMGPNGNVWLLDEHQGRISSLRRRSFEVHSTYSPPSLPEKLLPHIVTADTLREKILTLNTEEISVVPFLQKNIIGFDKTLSEEIAKRTGIESLPTKDPDQRTLEVIAREITELTSSFEKPQRGYLYFPESSPVAYPFTLASVSETPTTYPSLSSAAFAAINRKRELLAKTEEKKQTVDAVKRAIKRLELRLEKINQDIEDSSHYEEYKKMGELLQINFDKLKKGLSEITVENVFAPSPEHITISLEPSLSPTENIESFFKKYRKGKQGLELLKQRKKVTLSEIQRLREILSDLEKDFETAFPSYRQEIETLLPRSGTKKQSLERLPYREYRLSTGIKVLVGRGGNDNDETTFKYAKPYELWFHTQQCPGSHVVMKFPHKSYEPSKHEIEEAAAIAAFFSKARHDNLVPVLYTYRRYVRKPRKAKAGLVTVEREKSVLVSPRKPNE